MRFNGVYIAAVAVLLLCPAAVHGQVADFTDINDAVANRFFDPATTAPDPLDANRLIIGLHTGMDWTTWKATDFRASTASFSHGTAVDTIRFRITAPEGFYIAKVTFTQKGSGSVVRIGKAAGGGSWVVGDFADDLGVFATNPSMTRTVDLTGYNVTSVPVSITQSLFAFSPPLAGSATVSLTAASVHVELLPFEY